MARAHGIATRLDVASVGHLDPDVERALFRITQEAVTNVVRHSGAASVTVSLARTGDAVTLEVTDDGRGFDPGHQGVSSRRLGLVSMRERAADLGGTLTITSAAGQGTIVHAAVPAR